MGGYGRANTVIGLFEKVSHMAQKHHAGMQETCWDKANKGLASFKYGTWSKCFNMEFLYHVAAELQRTY